MPRTIAAIATPAGSGGICVIRVSGPDASAVADRVFRCAGDVPSKRATQTFVHGRVVTTDDDGHEQTVDDGILLIFRAPHSYTREDVIEIQGHGGRVCAQRILAATLASGASSAEPGEFTQRAFLNGGMDLMQAEAVTDLIAARSDRAANAAIEQLDGSLSRSFNSIYDDSVAAAADLESTLDFSDEELPDHVVTGIVEGLADLLARSEELLSTWNEGHLLRDGALIVISGKPNVGKSTLMNLLLGRERAIVADLPGTTRDSIEEELLIDGFPTRITDTAGLRETDCEVEHAGITRARDLIARADIHIHVLDAATDMDAEDEAQIRLLREDATIILVNKMDTVVRYDRSQTSYSGCFMTCSLHEDGLPDALMRALEERLSQGCDATPHAAISERHRELLLRYTEHLQAALTICRDRGECDALLAGQDMRAALDALGAATGRVYHDELLTSIFSRFCIGK